MKWLLVFALVAGNALANDVVIGLTGQEAGAQQGTLGDPPVLTVPEPGTLALLAIGAVALWRKRK